MMQMENGNGNGNGEVAPAISRICSSCHRDVATLAMGRIRIMPRSMQHFCQPDELRAKMGGDGKNWMKINGEIR